MFRLRLSSRRRAAGPSGGGAAPPVLDEGALGRLRELDPDGSRGFLVQVLRTYEASLQRHMVTLADAAAVQDIETAGRVAHTLKSSSASVGALGFAQCCAAVERLAKAADPEALGAPLAALRAEGQRVLQAVRAILPS